jgi:hypothetical protein
MTIAVIARLHSRSAHATASRACLLRSLINLLLLLLLLLLVLFLLPFLLFVLLLLSGLADAGAAD